MSFYKRYELARLIQEGDAKTFNAVEIATGRHVMLHMLAPSATLTAESVRDIVARAEQHPQVIEVGEFAGSYYIAAEQSDSFQSFRQWVETLPPAAPGKPVKPGPPTPPSPPSPPTPLVSRTEVRKLNIRPSPPAEPSFGEFTEIFGVPKAKIAGKNEAGEFTKMFYGEAPVKPSKVLPQVPADLNETGGEFTQLFGRQSAQTSPLKANRSADEFKAVFDAPLSEPEDAPPVAAAPPAPAWQDAHNAGSVQQDQTSEYTKFFGNSLPSEPVDISAEQARQAGVVEPKEKPFRQASDFTRMFGPGGSPANASPPPVVPALPSINDSTSVSMIFGSPQRRPEATKGPEVLPGAAPEADDYAKVVAAREDSGQASNPAAELFPTSTKGKKHIGLIVVLGVVGTVLLSLLIWVIFARFAK